MLSWRDLRSDKQSASIEGASYIEGKNKLKNRLIGPETKKVVKRFEVPFYWSQESEVIQVKYPLAEQKKFRLRKSPSKSARRTAVQSMRSEKRIKYLLVFERNFAELKGNSAWQT